MIMKHLYHQHLSILNHIKKYIESEIKLTIPSTYVDVSLVERIILKTSKAILPQYDD